MVETKFRFSKVNRTSVHAHPLGNYRRGIEAAFTREELQEFYRTRCRFDHSFRNGFNTSDVLPDWVTDISFTKRNQGDRDALNLPDDWISSEDSQLNMYSGDLPDWAR